MPFITITLTNYKAARALAQLSPAIRDALKRETQQLEDQVLSRAKELAATLRQVLTGKYASSFRGKVTDTPGAVVARIASGDRVANILEYGARIPPHDIVPAHAKALHFFAAGDVFSMRAHFPGAEIKGKPVLHQALREMEPRIVEGLSRAVNETIDRMMQGV